MAKKSPFTPTKDNPLVEVAEFTDAGKFLDALRMSMPWWWHEQTDQCPWVFRGQLGDTMMPSAWDGGSWVLEGLCKTVRQRHQAQLYPLGDEEFNAPGTMEMLCEFEAVARFGRECDKLGFTVTQSEFVDAENDPWFVSVPPGMAHHIPSKRLFALARHHGIPSRLLDFSEDSIVAAFFATQHPIWTGDRGRSPLVVWAISWPEFRQPLVGMLRVPRHDQPYLHAQHGVFLYSTHALPWRRKRGRRGKWFPLNHAIGLIARSPSLPGPVARKLSLPRRELMALRKLLQREGYNRARLMPSPDNIASDLIDTWDLTDPQLKRFLRGLRA